MAAARAFVLVGVLTLAALAFAPGATAAELPEAGGCGSDDVEVCFPVCVTDPCPGYVCVKTSEGRVCRTLG